jgi:hypothetical protein
MTEEERDEEIERISKRSETFTSAGRPRSFVGLALALGVLTTLVLIARGVLQIVRSRRQQRPSSPLP